MQWTLKLFDESIATAWDNFVNQNAHGSIHQISDWRNFQQQIPGREQVLGFYAVNTKDKIVATTWCVKMDTGFASKHWYYSARGPVMAHSDAKFKAEFLAAVAEKLKTEQGVFWRLDPYWQETDWKALTPHANLTIKPATKNFQPTDSLMLDLTLEETELKAQMHRQGRKALRLADEAGVIATISKGSEATETAIKQWFELNKDTTVRDGFAGHEISYYQNFLKTLGSQSYLCFAKHEGTPVAAAILTINHGKAIYYFGASSSDPATRNLRAPYALQWAMILFAKERGAKTYDFTGITPVDQPDHPYKGITQFKTRFGGYRDTYAAGKEVVLNAGWYGVYRLVKKLRR